MIENLLVAQSTHGANYKINRACGQVCSASKINRVEGALFPLDRKDANLTHTKVMFLSAKNKESDIEKGISLGADAYMTKPFSIKKVVEKVEELLA